MSDITIAVLHDREKYPDDTPITLPTGETVTVGQWRNAVLPKGDFTRATEGWSKKERELTSKQQELQDAVIGLQGQLREAIEARQPAPAAGSGAGEYSEESILNDPVLSVLNRRLEKKVKELQEAHEARFKQHEDTWLRANYQAQLSSLSSRYNARYNADGKGKAFDQDGFLKYAIDHGVQNLDVAYKGFTMDDEIAAVRKEAEELGEERGRKKAMVPNVPMGRRRGPVRPEGLPASLQELTDDAVLDDPDIQEALRGGEDQ